MPAVGVESGWVVVWVEAFGEANWPEGDKGTGTDAMAEADLDSCPTRTVSPVTVGRGKVSSMSCSGEPCVERPVLCPFGRVCDDKVDPIECNVEASLTWLGKRREPGRLAASPKVIFIAHPRLTP